ncbi:LuxR C-terminal-related transcriptional regulator [Arthrobacter sp. L77]|uniref:LuxR C-terminal-related transcriptional regulator n=1 Tax=Arthrobacter sp. L77 TaxID=1496689 RepID=UPI0005B9E29A|nr:LuxR C-terminal-related transcriptional regulator [Arthrobacter sp. L77]
MNSIIRAKTTVPGTGTHELDRPRLIARLDAFKEAGCRAVTLGAAAGSGKTTLAAQWARKRVASGDHVAWVSLDPSDNVPGRFWRLVTEALEPSDGVAPGRGTPPPPAAPAARIGWLDALLDHAGRGTVDSVLVLDNCEHLRDTGLLLEVDYAVQHAPRGFTVVFCGRQLPELPSFYRLDLDGALGRVGQKELMLRRREIARLFSPACPGVELLLEATEGWPAAVVLAHAMGDSDAPTAAVTDGTAYLDRLCGQLFPSFPEEVRAALAVMALIEPFTVEDLCAALASTDAPRVFDAAVRVSGLVVPVDAPGSFRLHRLLSRWLRGGGSGAAAIDRPLVHARMARRRLRQARHAEALAHAGRADDTGLLRDVAAVSGLHLLWSNDLAALDSVLRDLASVGSAELGLLDSLLSLAKGDPGGARLRLEHVDHAEDEGVLTEPFSALRTGLEAHLLLARGRPEEALEHLRGVCVEALPPDVGLFVSNIVSAALIAAAHLDEAVDAARACVAAADERDDNPGARIDAHITRAVLAAAMEDFEPAARDAWTAIREGELQRLRYSPRLRPAHLVLAWRAYHQLDDDDARFHNAFVVRAASTPPMAAHSAAKLRLMLSFASSTKPVEVAQALLDRIRFDLAHGAQPQDLAVCSLQAAEMMLSLRRVDDLTMLKVDLRRYQGISGELQIISVWEHLLAGQLNRSRQLLTPVTSEYVKCQSRIGMTTALAMLARLELLENRPFKAREALDRALTLASERGSVRGIRFAGETVRSALERDRHHYPRFAREVDLLVNQRRRPVQEIAGPPLTPREIELVALLPTFATVDELALDLQISTNTVKTHLRGIYRKLGVGTRREAIAAADKLGLLAPTPAPLRVLRSVSAR